MKKLKYKSKPQPQQTKVNTPNYYFPMLDTESLYPHNLSRLQSPLFKQAISKIAADLTHLLHMGETQFWKELQNNASLRVSLQSCLAVLPRREYSAYEVTKTVKRETIQDTNQYFRMYVQLTKAILYIYYRISSASTPENRALLYDQWLLDIPKMLDIAAIYGESNPQIVRKIISNSYEKQPRYDNDTLDFFQIVEGHKLLGSADSRKVEIDFSPSSLKSKYYGNRERFMIQQAVLQMFRVKDLLLNLKNFYTFFPLKYANQLASDYKIQERLIRFLASFLKQIGEDWKLDEYQKYFSYHIQDIRQSIAKYFIMEFKLLKAILEGSCSQQNIVQGAEYTYQVLCLGFSLIKDQAEKKYYRSMLNHLFEETEQTIFFLPVHKIRNPDKRTKAALQECVSYQAKYRKQKKTGGNSPLFEEAEERFKRSLEKWREIATAPKEPIHKEKRIPKQDQGYYLSQVNRLKYSYISDQYDDDFQEQDQFNRVEALEMPKQYNPNNLTIVMQKKKKYVQKQTKQSNLELSVWSNPADRITNTSFTESLSLINQSRSSFDQPTKNQGFKKDKTANKYKKKYQQKSITLSFVQEQVKSAPKTKQTPSNDAHLIKDLSFSLDTSVINKKSKGSSNFFEKSYDTQLKCEEQEIKSLLIDISSSIRQDLDTSFPQQAGQTDYGQNQEYLQFTWEDNEIQFNDAMFTPIM